MKLIVSSLYSFRKPIFLLMVMTWFSTFRSFAQCPPDHLETVNMAPLDGKYCTSPGVTINIFNSQEGLTYKLKLGTTVVDQIVGISGNIISFAPQLAGTYKVFKGNCTTRIAKKTIVYDNPVTATFVGFPEFCPTNPPTFTASPSGGTYQWYRNGNSISGATSRNYTPTQSGTYKVSVAKNGCGDMSNTQTMINATQYTPAVSIAIEGGGSSTICDGTSVTFKATKTYGGPSPIYQWKKNGNNVGTNSQWFTPNNLNNGDQIKVKMTSNSTKCLTTTSPVTSNIITMTVKVYPNDFAITGGGSYCYGGNGKDLKVLASQNGVTYQITQGGNPIGITKTGNGGTLNFGKHLAGTYSAIGTLNGCTIASFATATITEKPPVGASFVGFPEFCPTNPPSFTASPSGGTYQWYRNGNVISGATSKNYTPTQSGTYKVNVTINGCSEMTATQTMIDEDQFTPSVSIAIDGGGSSTICDGTSVTFKATPTYGGTSPSYQWRKNGAAVGPDNKFFTPANLDNGDQIMVEMTSNSTKCLTANPVTSNVITMTVYDYPEDFAVIGSPTTYCNGGNGVDLIVLASQSDVRYQITYGGNPIGITITGTGGDLNFGKHLAGTYSATGDLNGCIKASFATVVVTEKPPVGASFVGFPEYCPYQSPPTFTASPSGGSYQWYLNGGAINGETLQTFVPDQAGTYKVLVGKDGCSEMSNEQTMIDATLFPPSVSLSIIGGGGNLCEGDQVTFEATPTNGGTSPSYQWKEDGVNSGIDSPFHTVSDLSLGNLTIDVVMTSNLDECMQTNVATSSMTIYTNDKPYFENLVDGSGPYCAGGPGREITLSITEGGVTYQLKKDGVDIGGAINSLGDPITFGYHTEGTYIVTATSEFGGCTEDSPNAPNSVVITEISFVSTVQLGPPFQYCSTNPPTLTAQPNDGTGYQWYLDGNPINGATSLSHLTESQGNYSVAVARDGCNYISTPVTLNDMPLVTPSVSIAITQGEQVICDGEAVEFTATPTYGGVPPQYQWNLNGIPVAGETNAIFSTTSLSDQDEVTVTMTSTSSQCLTVPTVESSNSFIMTVHPMPTLTTSGDVSVCTGTSVLLSASGTGATAFLWFEPTYGTPYQAGTEFQTPLLETVGTTTYGVRAISNFVCTVEELLDVTVSATESHIPSDLTIDKLSNGNYQLSISTQAGYDYFWQSELNTQSENDPYLGPKAVNSGEYYFIKAKNQSTGCWGEAIGTEVPDLVPPSMAFTSADVNYVRTYSFLEEGIDITETDPAKLRITNNYIDGLGRNIQQVVKHGSGDSQNPTDLVQPIEYDALGREKKAYLPYVTTTTNGEVKNQPYQGQFNYYSNGSSQIAQSVYPITYRQFDNSPLNRVVEESAPGEAWAGQAGLETSRGIKTLVTPNSSGVAHWELDASGQPNKNANGHPVGALLVTKTTDENDNSVKEYTNKRGQVILKKVEGEAGTWLKTFYLYDDYGNLRFVLPPEIWANTTLDPGELDKYAFQYQYDQRQRLVEKKVPGADWVFLVYDKWDRLVLTQDGNQRANNEWTFTKYDVLNRPVSTGITQITGDRNAVQTAVNDFYAGQPLTARYETLGGTGTINGYTNNSYPQESVVDNYLTFTYYDDYQFKSELGLNATFDPAYPAGYSGGEINQARGQVTGTLTKILAVGSSWLTGVVYYDDKYRVIQTVNENHTQGLDRVSNEFDFIGKVLKTHYSHSGHQDLTIEKRFEYDHMGRLLKIFHSIDGAPEILLSELNYNELGELIEKNLHATDVANPEFLQSVDYRYNIRGWLGPDARCGYSGFLIPFR